ncbi:MAG: polyprenyl synthetase family protein [Tissierellia bacterium]|nr:polyprenyl synthetase family protein [Tissierellia bacterium]
MNQLESKKLHYFKEYFESEYIKTIQSTSLLSSQLKNAVQYAVSEGGKRLRPLLVFSTASALFKDKEDFLLYSMAIESIHSYSLIHDDLPAMDNDSLRRGKPTTHIAFGEGHAILAGDGLLNKAMEIALQDIENSLSMSKIQAYAYLFKCSGMEGMIDGQSYEMISKTYNTDQYFQIIEKKTGYLIDASIIGAAMIAEATTSQMKNLEKFSKLLGENFQIQDDIIDQDGIYELDATFAKQRLEQNKDKLNMLLESMSKNMDVEPFFSILQWLFYER